MNYHREKVVLVNIPPADYWLHRSEPMIGMPLGLLSIGVYLKANGIDVSIIDGVVDRDYKSIIEREIECSSPIWIGISTMTSGLADAKEVSLIIRKNNPNIPVVWGGVHATLFPDSVVLSGYADAAVIGDGEVPALQISERIINGTRNLSGIPQVAYLEKDRSISFTEQSGFVDINAFPKLDYSLIDTQKYLYRDLREFCDGISQGKIWIINTGRGCPFKCAFCINTHPSQKWRLKNADRMIDEFQEVVDKFNPDLIHIQDDLFFSDKKRIVRFMEEYDRRGWKFKFFTLAHANHFHEKFINRSMLSWLEGKAVWLGIGVESGSEKIRFRINKHITDKQVIEAVKMLKEFNIKLGLAFMTGLPIETKEDRFETIKFIEKINKINPLCTFALQPWRPYPGGELYEIAKEKGFQAPGTIDEWVQVLSTGQGYYDPMRLPWNNPNEIMFYLTFAASLGTRNRNLMRMTAYIFLYPFYKLRIITGNLFPFAEGFIIRLMIPIVRNMGFISKI